MQGITFHGPNDFRFEETKEPQLGSDSDAIIRVTRSSGSVSSKHS